MVITDLKGSQVRNGIKLLRKRCILVEGRLYFWVQPTPWTTQVAYVIVCTLGSLCQYARWYKVLGTAFVFPPSVSLVQSAQYRIQCTFWKLLRFIYILQFRVAIGLHVTTLWTVGNYLRQNLQKCGLTESVLKMLKMTARQPSCKWQFDSSTAVTSRGKAPRNPRVRECEFTSL